MDVMKTHNNMLIMALGGVAAPLSVAKPRPAERTQSPRQRARLRPLIWIPAP